MILDDARTGAATALRAVASVPHGLTRAGLGMLRPPFGAAAPPRPALAREQYRTRAKGYDLVTSAGQPYRRRSVERLSPGAGEVILDVGCGTGLNFEQIQDGIGPSGTLVGIDASPDMLARAEDRSARHGWDNVTLIQAPAQDAEIPFQADGALLCATQDILRAPAALENVVRHLKPNGRIVAGGPKWASLWRPHGLALNFCTWQLNRWFVTTFEGFDRPWSHLAGLVPDLEVEDMLFGAGYIATGRRPPALRAV